MKTLALLLFFNIIGHGALVMFLFQSQSLLSPLFDIRMSNVLVPPAGSAFRKYLALLPNSDKVPCVSDEAGSLEKASGCRG